MTEVTKKQDGKQVGELELPKIDRHQFFFETPLYSLIESSTLTQDIFSGEVDAFSNQFKSPTTYTISTGSVADSWRHEFDGVNRITLENKRNDDEKLVFFVINYDSHVAKIGQLPSLATLQSAGIDEKYRKILGKKYANFTKSIGLAANGVGAGSLVYLRKIFADLIDESYDKHKAELVMSLEDYRKLKMADRVTALQEYLPSQLVEMKGIYSILSSGVHDLTESECLAYFAPLKLSIELILDELIEQKAKADRNAAVKAQLRDIQATIKARQSN